MTTELRTTWMYICYTNNATTINPVNNKANTIFFLWCIRASISFHFITARIALTALQNSALVVILTIQLCGSFAAEKAQRWTLKAGSPGFGDPRLPAGKVNCCVFGLPQLPSAFSLPSSCSSLLPSAVFRIKKYVTFKKSFKPLMLNQAICALFHLLLP